ncbi:MAG: phosphocholine cytidylyltransferase family protein [Bacteroidales bacterium]|nr:phosphocholine cytidylyltransferase family protein [Bacteroidales bacterium]
MIQTAVIMAAGLGTRFGKYTELIPKGFVEFNDRAMVLRSIDTLIDCGIERIIIGTGWKKEMYEALMEKYPQIECVYSPHYAETNSMFTLYSCREAIGNEDFLLLESDLVYERKAITELLSCPFPSAMLIAPVTKFQDQYYVQMNEKCELINCSTDRTRINPSGELVGIHKLSNVFFQEMVEDYMASVDERLRLGYEFQLLLTSQNIMPLNVLKLDNLLWYEIDDEADLEYAEKYVPIL